MKQSIFIIILTLVTYDSFCQKENSVRPFVNPVETKPRFIEDQHLSENENLKSFNQKIKVSIVNKLKNSPIIDSISNKICISFKIDTFGRSQFYKIRPVESETRYLIKEISALLDSLPKFIPATQRNKKTSIIYVIPISINE